ncbi:MAG: pilus assembly protein [Lachnospiraceae bacterium]|nr:pilus assembly protein [Lachnospiraceae bacterium]
MTIEAAIVLPLLLCAFMGILMWAQVMMADQEMQTALLETGRQLARKEYLLSEKGQEGASVKVSGVLFRQIQRQENGASAKFVSGISLAGSEYRESSKELYLHLQYKVKINTLLLGNWQLRLRGGLIQKAWNGYAPAEGETTDKGSDYVYVTEDGEVYHTDGQCYHLHVTISETTDVDPYYDGKTSYRPCEHCIHKGDGRAGVLYIPKEGDCYHTDPSCSGLTRTVHYVKKEEIGDLRPCSHCGQK